MGKGPRGQPRKGFARRVRGHPGPLSRWLTLPGRRGRAPGERLAYSLGSDRQCVCTYLAHRLTRWMGSRHASFASLPPSKPFAPVFSFEDILIIGAAGASCQTIFVLTGVQFRS
jgi:hypothetical protein